jgi:hypothetical protein
VAIVRVNRFLEAVLRWLVGKLDTLAHRLGRLPRWSTGWLCDAQDRALGMSWDEIRQARRGQLPGYFNGLDPLRDD